MIAQAGLGPQQRAHPDTYFPSVVHTRLRRVVGNNGAMMMMWCCWRAAPWLADLASV